MPTLLSSRTCLWKPVLIIYLPIRGHLRVGNQETALWSSLAACNATLTAFGYFRTSIGWSSSFFLKHNTRLQYHSIKYVVVSFFGWPYFVVEDSKTIQARMMVDVCMKFGVWKRLGEQFVNLLCFESWLVSTIQSTQIFGILERYLGTFLEYQVLWRWGLICSSHYYLLPSSSVLSLDIFLF
jgi:hypothetical protein